MLLHYYDIWINLLILEIDTRALLFWFNLKIADHFIVVHCVQRTFNILFVAIFLNLDSLEIAINLLSLIIISIFPFVLAKSRGYWFTD